jgi:hypothetical protein
MNAVARIFWPTSLLDRRPCSGYLIGWNLRSFITCVAMVVTDTNVRYNTINSVLILVRSWTCWNNA